MRRLRTGVMAALMTAMAMSPFAMQHASAETQAVDVWMTIGTNHPAPGCVVDASIEVRSGGGALTDADVAITLSNDADNAFISSDRGVTDDSGIAYLSFDTSGATDAKTWLQVVVNGAYVGGQSVWVDGSACDGGSTVLDLSGDMPSVSSSYVEDASESTDTAAADDSGAVILPNVSAYQQQRNLSCEYASISIATGALGSWVSEYDMEAVTPLDANPHWGYRGDITGWWGNTDDYGIYAEALVPGLNDFGFQGHVFYGGDSDLVDSIDLGRPTLVWLGMWGDLSHTEYAEDGTPYQLTQAMHVMVAYGYDDGGVYLSDPGAGVLRYYDWGTFNAMWSVMDGMALGVSW